MKARLETVCITETVHKSMGFEHLPGAILDAALVLTLNNKELQEIVEVQHTGHVISITIRRKGIF